MSIKAFFKEIKELTFPRGYECLICQREISVNEKWLCECCSFLQNNKKICKRCGRPINNESDYCNNCLGVKYNYDNARSALLIDEPLRKLIHDFKYGSKKYLSVPLSLYLYNLYKELNSDFDVVTCAPISEKRLKKRGYNQAEVLAAELVKRLEDIKYLPNLLIKIKDIPNQARLSRRERFENIKGSIGFSKGIDIKGSRVLFVDDVFTTGATSDECARILKKHGAISVQVLTLATGIRKTKNSKTSEKQT